MKKIILSATLSFSLIANQFVLANSHKLSQGDQSSRLAVTVIDGTADKTLGLKGEFSTDQPYRYVAMNKVDQTQLITKYLNKIARLSEKLKNQNSSKTPQAIAEVINAKIAVFNSKIREVSKSEAFVPYLHYANTYSGLYQAKNPDDIYNAKNYDSLGNYIGSRIQPNIQSFRVGVTSDKGGICIIRAQVGLHDLLSANNIYIKEHNNYNHDYYCKINDIKARGQQTNRYYHLVIRVIEKVAKKN